MSNENPKVLLVDDDKDLLQLIAMRLTAVGLRGDGGGERARRRWRRSSVSRPQVVVTDLRMQGMDGMALFDAIHRDSPSLAGGDPDRARHDSRGGGGDPARRVLLPDQAVRAEGAARHGGRGDAPFQPDRRASMEDWRAELITRSSAMEDLLAQARRVAASDASVCIFGAERHRQGAAGARDPSGEPAARRRPSWR